MEIPEILTAAAGIAAIIIAAWKISGQISRLDARMDGIEKRMDAMQGEIHSINEHLRAAA